MYLFSANIQYTGKELWYFGLECDIFSYQVNENYINE